MILTPSWGSCDEKRAITFQGNEKVLGVSSFQTFSPPGRFVTTKFLIYPRALFEVRDRLLPLQLDEQKRTAFSRVRCFGIAPIHPKPLHSPRNLKKAFVSFTKRREKASCAKTFSMIKYLTGLQSASRNFRHSHRKKLFLCFLQHNKITTNVFTHSKMLVLFVL